MSLAIRGESRRPTTSGVQAYAPPALSAAGRKYRIVVRKFGTLIVTPVITPFLIADGWNPPVLRTPKGLS